MDPFARASTVRQYLNSPRRYGQELYFENGQKESPLDIQDGYDKFNDNVKYSTISRHKHLL
jgi:hypothetical protein